MFVAIVQQSEFSFYAELGEPLIDHEFWAGEETKNRGMMNNFIRS